MAPGSLEVPRGISTGQELVSEAELPSGPRHTCCRAGTLPAPHASPGGRGGRGSQSWSRKGAVLLRARAAQSSSSSLTVAVGALS